MAKRLGLLSLVERGARFVLNRRGFQSLTVPTEAGELHVYDARGPAMLPTVVLLHGLGSTATAFGPLLTRMQVAWWRSIYRGTGSARLPPAD